MTMAWSKLSLAREALTKDACAGIIAASTESNPVQQRVESTLSRETAGMNVSCQCVGLERVRIPFCMLLQTGLGEALWHHRLNVKHHQLSAVSLTPGQHVSSPELSQSNFPSKRG